MEKANNLSALKGIGHGFFNRWDSTNLSHPLLMTQVHSADVRVIDKMDETQPMVDAWVSREPDLCLTVKTADCAPVLLADADNRVIGAVHAGWKGAFQGVIENAVLEMLKKGAKLNKIRAAVGPCLHLESFEVDTSFKALFPKTEDRFFIAKGENKFLFDFIAYIRHRMERIGIQDIEVIDIDTYTHPDYLSYRQEPDNPARQFSAIWLKK